MYSLSHATNWKKYSIFSDTVRNCGSRFSSSCFWLYKCFDNYWIVGFNFRDFFFIRYLRQKDNHYDKDLIPVLERWCNQDTNLQFHVSIRAQSFHNMFLNLVHNMRFLDRMSVARDHLYSYDYSDNRSFELLQRNVGIYNNMVGSFVNSFTDDIEIFLKTELPHIRLHKQKEDPQTNFYHYSSILYYFWLVYWQSRNGRQETRLEMVQNGDAHHLKIAPNAEPIASASDKDDVIKLQTFMTNKTPNVIFRLTRLNQYRNEVIEQFTEFKHNIERLLENQAWTRPISGRCRWEQQYFSIRDKE